MDNKTKKHLYHDLWILTGFLLGILSGALIELAFLRFGTVAFPIYYIYAPTLFAGVFFGLWAGPVAWRKIYIEGVRGKKYVIK